MPEQTTIQRAREDRREGKSLSTQAGEFAREEFHHLRQGKRGPRSATQAIAIGLSKARRAGVKLPPVTDHITQLQAKTGARERNSNLHPLRDRILSPARLPFRHARNPPSTCVLRPQISSPVLTGNCA